LNSRVIPLLAVVTDGIFFPYALGFGTSRLFQIFRRAAPGPFRPEAHVAVMHRVVVNVVDGREEVSFRTHEPLGGAMEHLPSPRVLFAVPSVAGASVKTSQFLEEFENVRCFDERMVMIG